MVTHYAWKGSFSHLAKIIFQYYSFSLFLKTCLMWISGNFNICNGFNITFYITWVNISISIGRSFICSKVSTADILKLIWSVGISFKKISKNTLGSLESNVFNTAADFNNLVLSFRIPLGMKITAIFEDLISKDKSFNSFLSWYFSFAEENISYLSQLGTNILISSFFWHFLHQFTQYILDLGQIFCWV